MTTCNPETGDILSQLKTFKTGCAAFPAQVRELVRKLNGEYGLSGDPDVMLITQLHQFLPNGSVLLSQRASFFLNILQAVYSKFSNYFTAKSLQS